MQFVLNALVLFAIGTLFGLGVFSLLPDRDWRGFGGFVAGCLLWAFGMALLFG